MNIGQWRAIFYCINLERYYWQKLTSEPVSKEACPVDNWTRIFLSEQMVTPQV